VAGLEPEIVTEPAGGDSGETVAGELTEADRSVDPPVVVRSAGLSVAGDVSGSDVSVAGDESGGDVFVEGDVSEGDVGGEDVDVDGEVDGDDEVEVEGDVDAEVEGRAVGGGGGGVGLSWRPVSPCFRANHLSSSESCTTKTFTTVFEGATTTIREVLNPCHGVPLVRGSFCATGSVSGFPQAQRTLGSPLLSTRTAVPAWSTAWYVVTAPFRKPWFVTRVSARS
jgi:hypothetical protein